MVVIGEKASPKVQDAPGSTSAPGRTDQCAVAPWSSVTTPAMKTIAPSAPLESVTLAVGAWSRTTRAPPEPTPPSSSVTVAIGLNVPPTPKKCVPEQSFPLIVPMPVVPSPQAIEQVNVSLPGSVKDQCIVTTAFCGFGPRLSCPVTVGATLSTRTCSISTDTCPNSSTAVSVIG